MQILFITGLTTEHGQVVHKGRQFLLTSDLQGGGGIRFQMKLCWLSGLTSLGYETNWLP